MTFVSYQWQISGSGTDHSGPSWARSRKRRVARKDVTLQPGKSGWKETYASWEDTSCTGHRVPSSDKFQLMRRMRIVNPPQLHRHQQGRSRGRIRTWIQPLSTCWRKVTGRRSSWRQRWTQQWATAATRSRPGWTGCCKPSNPSLDTSGGTSRRRRRSRQ